MKNLKLIGAALVIVSVTLFSCSNEDSQINSPVNSISTKKTTNGIISKSEKENQILENLFSSETYKKIDLENGLLIMKTLT